MRFETKVTIVLLPLVCKPSVSIYIMVNENSSAKNMEDMGDTSDVTKSASSVSVVNLASL